MRRLACLTLAMAIFGNIPAFAQGGGYGSEAGSSLYQLSASEAQYLTYLREEEKLARDVYITFQQHWGLDIFANISMSEQQHMDAIKNLLDKYGVADPAHVNVGVFTNQDLQAAYQALVTGGTPSLVAALRAGGYIEELDLKDLQSAADNTSRSDLLQVYSNLMRASRNHLRAFAGQLENRGVAYDAQVLTHAEVDAILDSPMERGGK